MRLAVRFSPPEGAAGSQRTIAENLIPALFAAHDDTLLFTSAPREFPGIPRGRVVVVPSANAGRNVLGTVLSQLRHELTFERRLVEHGRDVVYYPYTNESTLGMRDVRQVVTVHDVIPLVFPEQFPATSRLWRYLLAPRLRRADAVIAVSDNTAADAQRLVGVLPERIRVSHGGFRVPAGGGSANRATVQPPYLLYVASSLYPYKNTVRLAEAFATLTARFAHRLVIVGRVHPRFRGLVDDIYRAAGDRDRVTILGDVSDAELAGLYSRADVFVYPSLYEGFGIPPLEAMAAGVPVVAARCASIPEVCGDAAEYCDPTSSASIAAAIARVLGSDSRRAELRQAGLERVGGFGWTAAAQRVVSMCAAALK